MKRAIQIGGPAAVIVLFAMTALPLRAADSVVLRNGFSIRYERRQDMGLITRLYMNADGSSFVDVPTADIDHIETTTENPASAVSKPVAPAAPLAQRALPDNSKNPINLNELVASASGDYKLDPDLVNSVIRAESGFNVRAVSPKGAQGLMQLMPQTASELGVQNAFDPQANVQGGTRYLRELLERYNFDLIKALAAYNAGPERVEQYGGVPPYYETKAYVARIVRDFNRKKLAQKKAAAAQKSSTTTKSAKTAPVKQGAQVAQANSAAHPDK
jgi:soluble lytic murein transglycosylase-like protein